MTETSYFIIAGHGKTGSTYLQQCLSRSRAILKDRGVDYPEAAGETHSGNGKGLLFRKEFSTAAPRVLYCNEHIWHQILGLDNLGGKLHQLGKPSFLIFIRDPLEHAISVWRQGFKKGRQNARDLESYCASYDIPTRMRTVISRLDELGIDLTVRNYSRVRADIVGEVETWLGVEGLIRGDIENRSLTESEMHAISILTREGSDPAALASMFIRALPHEVEPLTGPPRDVQERMLERLADDIAWMNARVGDQGYNCTLLPVAGEGALTLKPEHIQAMAEVLSGRAERVGLMQSLKARLRRAQQVVRAGWPERFS